VLRCTDRLRRACLSASRAAAICRRLAGINLPVSLLTSKSLAAYAPRRSSFLLYPYPATYTVNNTPSTALGGCSIDELLLLLLPLAGCSRTRLCDVKGCASSRRLDA
jgi:hypothetical protein